ncbi:MAG: TPM domain-containing protein [Nitrospira sp.]|nr:TPM domain-containing protein [Nitrospira sp.]
MAIGKVIELSQEDRQRISEAVRAAERKTSAEIIPMLVARSGLYREARYRTGLALALVLLTILLTGEALWLPWGWHAANAAWLILAMLAAYGIGIWLGTFGSVIRTVTSIDRQRHKVKLRAERAFAQHGIAQTSERTGILLMVSLLERQVYLLPDRGLTSQVTTAQWDEVVKTVVEKLKEQDIAGGLCAGIERCGILLAQVSPATSGGNPNELPDIVIDES